MRPKSRYTFYGQRRGSGRVLEVSPGLDVKKPYRPIIQTNIYKDNLTGLWLVVPPEDQGDVETYPNRDTAFAAAMHRDWET